jgi:superfamily I DNA/RNA helicase
LPNNKSYTEAKRERHVLDYDDLLLYWFHLLGDETFVVRFPSPAPRVYNQ